VKKKHTHDRHQLQPICFLQLQSFPLSLSFLFNNKTAKISPIHSDRKCSGGQYSGELVGEAAAIRWGTRRRVTTDDGVVGNGKTTSEDIETQ
jgi:hypothetical protein